MLAAAGVENAKIKAKTFYALINSNLQGIRYCLCILVFLNFFSLANPC